MLRAHQLQLMATQHETPAQPRRKQIAGFHGFSVEIKSTFTVLRFPPTSTAKHPPPPLSGLQTGRHRADAVQSRNLRSVSPTIISNDHHERAQMDRSSSGFWLWRSAGQRRAH